MVHTSTISPRYTGCRNWTSGKLWEISRKLKNMLDNGCPKLEEGIDYEAMGLKWYRGWLIPLSYYPGLDYRNYANWLWTISPSVPPPDSEIPIPPPSPDKSKMLPPPTPPTMGKEKETDEGNIGGLLMDLAENGSEDETRTATMKDTGTAPPGLTKRDASTSPLGPTEKHTSKILPGPTKQEACTITPAPTEKESGTTLPAPTGKEASTAPEEPIYSMQQGTPQPNRPTTPSSDSSSSDDVYTKNDDYVSCLSRIVRPQPQLQQNVGRQDEDVGISWEKNGEQSCSYLPTSSKRRPRVVLWGQGTNHSGHVRDAWDDSLIPYWAWQHLILHKR